VCACACCSAGAQEACPNLTALDWSKCKFRFFSQKEGGDVPSSVAFFKVEVAGPNAVRPTTCCANTDNDGVGHGMNTMWQVARKECSKK
jgi:hypothetical protein